MNFSSVIVPSIFPSTWRDNALEVLGAEISDTLELVSRDGQTSRNYTGENLHRLIYNKAYLASMLTLVPDPAKADKVLEIGCSDGLACDLLAQLGANQIHGVDLWTESLDSEFTGNNIVFARSDATELQYPDNYFDLSFSIATFEHIQNPWAVLEEMHRVTKIGGHIFIQAGPLYHSPFGHHMFSYFANYPWAHLRHSPSTLARIIHESGKSLELFNLTGLMPEEYVRHMLGKEHINGLSLAEYRLEEFAAASHAKILKYSPSYEGRDLLTPEISAELSQYKAEILVEHGFECCITKLQ